MNLQFLTPAPWLIHEDEEAGLVYIPEKLGGFPMLVAELENSDPHATALEFAALARNAFDVMMRRQVWYPSYEHLWSDPERKDRRGWVVRELHAMPQKSTYRLTLGRIVGELGQGLLWADDPFTALVKADKWYAENVENASAATK